MDQFCTGEGCLFLANTSCARCAVRLCHNHILTGDFIPKMNRVKYYSVCMRCILILREDIDNLQIKY